MIWKDEIVRVSLINTGDHTFRITTEENIENLSRSIKISGLINNPLIIRNKSGYSVVSGFRRIRSAANLGWTEIPARVLEPDTDLFECAKLAVTENLQQRPLNLIELSRCYKILSGFCEDRDPPAAAYLLGLSENPSLAGKIIRLCGLPEELQRYILSGSLSMAIALELVKPEYAQSGIQLAEIFDNLKLSLNKQREILTLSLEISKREDISVPELINCADFQKILSDEDSDRNLKTNRIRHYLKSRRFPSIMLAENNFRDNLKKLALPEGIKLIPPAGFEGNTFIINMEFKTFEEFAALAAFLDRLKDDPASLFSQVIKK